MMPYILRGLSLSDMTECGAQLRRLGRDASSMEDAANRVVRWLYAQLADDAGGPACAMVRFYKTQLLADLPDDLAAFAREAAGEDLPPHTRCLTLLASAGDEPEWNDRRSSRGHRAIPLQSPEAIRQMPMILQLVQQLGFDPSQVAAPSPALLVDSAEHTFNVFYVPTAHGSPFIPAQDGFVVKYGIESVLGFGGLLPPGELFSVILFSRVPITPDTAELFKPLSLSARMAVLPFSGGQVFE